MLPGPGGAGVGRGLLEKKVEENEAEGPGETDKGEPICPSWPGIAPLLTSKVQQPRKQDF